MIIIGKLKPKEKLFCFYYAKLQNSKEAAIKADYSFINAESVGDKLLQRKDIVEEINSLCKSQEYEDLLSSVIAGLKRIAFSSPNDSILLAFKNIDEVEKVINSLDLFTVTEIKRPKENALEIKFLDKFKAFDKLVEIINSRANSSNDFLAALEASSSLIKQGDLIDEV